MDGDRSEKPKLIGISDKINSGKDLLGEIIQYLSCLNQNILEERHKSFETFRQAPGMNAIQSGFEIKKFADKLKCITCLLLGCTREQLEDREFKGTLLGEEWTKYGIVREFGTRLVDIQGTREEAEARLSVWGGECKIEKIHMTPRLFLQLLGTEAGRQILHPNIWVNALFADYTETYIGNKGNTESEHSKLKKLGIKQILPTFPNWIITDVRFPNEAQAVKNRGGIMIRVNRPDKGNTDNHPSEISLDNYQDWDHVIENNGTIEDLIEKVKQLNLV